MPDYPIESGKLLDAADLLAPTRSGRPSYTAHRRAVSTAYYAVFHAISSRVADAAFSTADAAFKQRVRRWIGHGDIGTIAAWVSQLADTTPGSPPRHIVALLTPAGNAPHIDADTVTIANGFLELNAKREEADYDHEAVFTRAETRGHIALARQVVDVAEQRRTDASERFFGLIAMQAKIRGRQ